MTDNVTLPGTGASVATDDVAGVQFQRVKLDLGGDGATVPVVGALPVSGPVTDGQLRATPVPVSGTVAVSGTVPVSGPLTDAQIRAAALPVSGTVAVSGTVPVSGPVTDAQIRASALPVSGPVTDAQLRASAVPVSGTVEISGTVPVSGPITDAQIRATALPVSGTVGISGTVPVSGPLTNTELRASALSIVEPAVTQTGQAAQTALVNNILEATAGATGTTVDNFRSASVQVVSTGTAGAFIFEQSNDGTNWIALPVYNSALTTGVPILAAITATASAIIYTIPLRCRFLRLRISTAITGGSIQAFSRFSTEPWTPTVATVAQPTAASLLATVSQGTAASLQATATLAAGAAAVGDVGTQYRANATGAASALNFVAAASTNATIVKASAGRLLGWSLLNTTAAPVYVKTHNIATAPTAGAGVTGTIAIPANGNVSLQLPGGVAFTTGIGITTVTGSAATDATAVAAGAVVGTLYFA